LRKYATVKGSYL